MLRHKGQSTLEYAVIIAVVVGALLVMQIYMKRGMQGRMREAADDLGSQFEAGATEVKFLSKRTGTSVEVTTDGVTNVYTGSAGSAGGEAQGAAEVSKFSGEEHVATFDGEFTPTTPSP